MEAQLSQDAEGQLWVIIPDFQPGQERFKAMKVKNNDNRTYYGSPCLLKSDHTWPEGEERLGLLVGNHEGKELGVICPICSDMM